MSGEGGRTVESAHSVGCVLWRSGGSHRVCICAKDAADLTIGMSTPETDAVLAILRRHTIGAFNGTQVACAAPECRAWMKTDDWHQHVARLIEDLSSPPGPTT